MRGWCCKLWTPPRWQRGVPEPPPVFMGAHFQGRLAAARQRLAEVEVMDSRVLHVQKALDAIEMELASYLGGCRPFVGLAFANLIFDSLQRSNKALDLLLASVHIQEASYWNDWNALMCRERDDQIEFVSALLEDPIRLDEALGGAEELLVLQMMLKHCFEQCAFDVVRQEEMELMVRLYDWVVLLSDTVVLSVPDRFAVHEMESLLLALANRGRPTPINLRRLGVAGYTPEECEERCLRQAKQWGNPRNPIVVPLLLVCPWGHRPCLMWQDGQPLADYLDGIQSEETRTRETWQRLQKVALALRYLRHHRIVHGNLQSEFIVVGTWMDDKCGPPTTRIIPPGYPLDEDDSHCAAWRWQAPERLRGCPPSYASDVFSLGMCIVEILSGDVPWGIGVCDDMGRQSVLSGALPPRPNSISDYQWCLVEEMCASDPTSRPDVQNVAFRLGEFAWQTRTSSRGENRVGRNLQKCLCDLSKRVPSKSMAERIHLTTADICKWQTSLRAWQTLPNAFVALACSGNVCLSLESKLEFIQASCTMKNSLIFENWRCNLLQERETQVETVRQILDDDDDVMTKEMSGDRDVMQDMTLLQYAFGRFADRFIETEVEVGTRAFNLLAERSGTLVVSVPAWFNFPSPTYDVFQTSSGESKWPMSFYGKPALLFRLPDSLAHSEEVCLRQANLWSSLSHPHVVTLFGACHVGYPYFVYEYGASLHSYLLWPGRRRLLWSRMHEIALGLQFLHKRGVVYEGLSCRNVRVVEDELKQTERVKLSGLGFVRAGTRIKVGLSDEDSTIREHAWQWKAPECLAGEITSCAANVYSLGMCIVEAVTGDFPWGRYIGELIGIELIRAGRLPPSNDGMPCSAWKLVESMCKLDPEQRISIPCALSKLKELADDTSRSDTTAHQRMSP